MCKKVNNQLNVVIRFRNFICTATKLKFYNAFIVPHFQYCSTLWLFRSARNCGKLESLNERALHIVLMIKFRPTSSYYINQEEQLYTTKGFKICYHYLQMF